MILCCPMYKFSKSKKYVLRNTKSDKLYIIGVRWNARLAFVRHVNRHARAIARLLLTGLLPCLYVLFSSTKVYEKWCFHIVWRIKFCITDHFQISSCTILASIWSYIFLNANVVLHYLHLCVLLEVWLLTLFQKYSILEYLTTKQG